MEISWKEMKSKINLGLLEKSHDLRIEMGLWVFKDCRKNKWKKEQFYSGDSIYKFVLTKSMHNK